MSFKYKGILDSGADEFIEKKSRFIGYAFKVESEEEALLKIDEIKTKHYDATHNCTAYIIGEDRLIQRYNDDGEPSGTAGVPILEVLKREELTNVVVIVTRYFGGTLLGAGGLVRAYSKGAKIAVDAAKIVDMCEFDLLNVTYDYTFHGAILNYLIKNGYKVLEEKYMDKVTLEFHADESDKRLVDDLNNETNGAVKIEKVRKDILPVIDGKIVY